MGIECEQVANNSDMLCGASGESQYILPHEVRRRSSCKVSMPQVIPCVFVIGPAGSGKSRIAKALVKQLHGVYLDKDIVCNAFTGALLEGRGYDASERDGNAYYRDDLMPLEYQTLISVGNDNLALGIPVVFDAPFGAYFSDESYIERLRERFAWDNTVVPIVVHVQVPGEVVRKRIIERGLARDSWKLQHWDEFWAQASGASCVWNNAHHIAIDNTADTADGSVDIRPVLDLIQRLRV